jgi:hypothetical protein
MQNDSASFARKWARERGLKSEELTAGFALFCPRLLGVDGRFLCVWGMGGTETLFLSHAFSTNSILRDTLRKLIRSQEMHFLLLQWPSKLNVPIRPTSLDFMRSQTDALTKVVHVKARIPKQLDRLKWERV